MGIQILKLRVKTRDTGRTYIQIAGELVSALRKFDGFIELDVDVSDTISDEDLQELEENADELELSDNQKTFVENALSQGYEVNYKYSGTGMTGRTCPSIRVDRRDEFDSDTDHSTDSLGHGFVIYART